MANGWLAGLGGFSQGLSRGLEQGWDAQQRQQEIDAAKYTRSLQNLSTALTMADLYPEMRGSLLKTWGEQNRRQGVGFDPALTEILAKAPTEASQDIAQLLSGGHEQWAQAIATNPRLKAAFAKDPFAVGRFMLELKKQSQDQDALQTTQKILTRAQPKTVFPVAPMEAGAPAQGAPSGTPAGEPVSPARVRLQELQTQIETINEQYSALVRSGKKQMPGVREGLDKEIHRLETARDRLSMSAFAQELGPRTQRYVGKGMDEGSARNQAAMDLLAAGMKPPPGLEHFAPGQKEFAPTELQGWLTEAARQLGKTYRPGGPIDPDVNKLALKLYQDWRRETFAPKGPETSIAWRAAQLARSRGVPEEQVNQIYERALRDSRFALSYLGGAGTKAGGFAVEAGEVTEPPAVFPAPGVPPGGAPGGPAQPRGAIPFGGEPGTTPLQKREKEKFLGTGLPAETQDVIAGFDNISALMQQIRSEFTPQELRRYVGFVNKPAAQVAQITRDDPRVARFLNLTNQARMMAFDLGGKQLTPMEKRVVESILPMGTELSFENFMANIKGTEERITRLRDSRIKSATTTRGEALRGRTAPPAETQPSQAGPTMSPQQQQVFDGMPDGARIKLGGQYFIKRNGKLTRPK